MIVLRLRALKRRGTAGGLILGFALSALSLLAQAQSAPASSTAVPVGPPASKAAGSSGSETPAAPSTPPESPTAKSGSADAGQAIPGAATTTSTGASPQDGTAAPLESDLRVMQERVDRVKDLLDGKLDPAIDVEVLFGFPLDDPELLKKELIRIHSSIAQLRGEADKAATSAAEAIQPKAATAVAATGGASSAAGDNTKTEATTPIEQPASVATNPDGERASDEALPPRSRARLRLELIKLRFFSLPDAERQRLLKLHQDARDTYLAELDGAASARQRAEEAERERLAAIEAARIARTEAERLVNEERARLLEIQRLQAETDGLLSEKRKAIQLREERHLKLQRRTRELLAGEPNQDAAAVLFSECEEAAETAQNAFSSALSRSPVDVPKAGDNPLDQLQLQIDTAAITKLRRQLDDESTRLEHLAEDVLWQGRGQLYRELRDISASRLALLQEIPVERRSDVQSFSPSGFSRAVLEVRQVLLILRYHTQLTTHWIDTLRRGRKADGPNAVTSGAVLLELLVLAWLFFWVNKRIPLVIKGVRERTVETMRHGSLDAGRNVLRWLFIGQNVYRPALVLVWLWLMWRALPEAAQGQLEVALLFYCFIWLVSANLLIHFIDAVFGGAEASRSSEGIARVRLRSLRLVGRTIAYIGLSLSLTSRLVGEGTIYQWVLNITWILILPTVLLLCFWWRPFVIEALSKERRKTALHDWILAHQKGLVGLLAAGVGGVDYLRITWSRVVRQRADEFVVTQRIGAYLFQRELDRRAEEEEQLSLQPLGEDLFEQLRPQQRSLELIETSTAEDCAVLRKALDKKRGGLFALVGERGAGKSTQAELLSKDYRTLVIESQDTLPELREAVAQALGIEQPLTLKQLIESIEQSDEYDLIIFDSAHRLIHPWIGGIASFDQLVGYMRPHSTKLAWLCCFEDAVWNFFEGARGAQPTFDHVAFLSPWSEADVRRFLEARSKAVGVEPNFRLLVSQVPKDADAIDWAEAMEKAKKSYFRLIWDYSAGNPAVALHMWGRSLAGTRSGMVFVQLFQPPRAEDIESLPDSAAFVLRAIVQLGFATLREISQVTRLGDRVILDTVRYAIALGVVYETPQGYRITWAWYRAVSRFLQRRHLLSIRFLRSRA